MISQDRVRPRPPPLRLNERTRSTAGAGAGGAGAAADGRLRDFDRNDVAEDATRRSGRKWRSVYGKRRFELLLLPPLHPSRPKAARGDTTKTNSKFLRRRLLHHSANPRLSVFQWPRELAKSINKMHNRADHKLYPNVSYHANRVEVLHKHTTLKSI